MSKNIEQLIENLSSLTVMEAADLAKALEERWGVSAAAPVAVAVAPSAAGATEAVVEKTEFDVHLITSGDKKIDVIKVVRAITGLGLKEAKDLVDGAPAVVKAAAAKSEAEEMKAKLEEVGAKVDLK